MRRTCSVEGCGRKHRACGYCMTCYQRTRYQTDPQYREHKKAAYRHWHQQLRAKVIAFLGGPVCRRCGAVECLEIDHVNDNGAEHRRAARTPTVLRYVLTHPDEFQILCQSCNRAKASLARKLQRC
jgi:hypothetical protein